MSSAFADPGIFARVKGVQAHPTEKISDNVFVVFFFLSSTSSYLTVLQRGSDGLFLGIISLSKVSEGVQHFPGAGSNFFQGGIQMLISIET